MPQLIIALISGTVIILIIGNAITRFNKPAKNPKAFLKKGKQENTDKVIVCAGDSHTHGVVGANYVKLLENRFASKNYEFINAGINGNLAWNVLQRLDDIIACQPDIITILIGTNDVNASFSQQSEDQYRRDQKIPEKPTLDWYRLNIEKIIERLQSETDAKIAFLSLPMLGEDLDSESNAKITAYNEALKSITEEKGVTYLALNEKLSALLPENHNAPPYEGKIEPILEAIMQHYIFRKSWHKISEKNGFIILTDHLHMNDKGAEIIAELITDFLDKQ